MDQVYEVLAYGTDDGRSADDVEPHYDAKDVHNKDPSPLSKYVHADPASNLAQSREPEADDSSMIPLSAPGQHAAPIQGPSLGP